jgi:hypothetical protein
MQCFLQNLAKIIANRLKQIVPRLILPNQGGFVAKRQIWDNITLVQEAIHSSFNNREKGMVIKIDMENAFDRVKHSFLIEVLKKMVLITPLSPGLEPVLPPPG